ncbi:hypothetical protein K503DRAFT_805589 [Rhizopogon vinicolor AM-OR11-026]|uniref:Amino acid permease/ SLC12A domain-containing protein n=1 Tax=Rhizopogon vinicolor AM-OR11-026 TaxID=1314800 RepID=A0A1B7MHE9_9AGAM|nr:hypothetical protein K503DRAFT_805589 [Rhizopogon vinicolor AM-OR11-026]
MVALTCFGTIVAGVRCDGHVYYARLPVKGYFRIQDFFASTRPFGTPLAPICLQYFLTVFALVAFPAEDAFNFLVDLLSYPNLVGFYFTIAYYVTGKSQVFHAAIAIGVWLLRRRRILVGLAPSKYRARNINVFIYLLSALFLLIMPWVPPEPGHGDVSFWYATYCVAGLGVLALCGVYYWIWIVFLP